MQGRLPLRRWAWLCPIAAIAIAIGVVAFFDLSFWHAALVALLLVCPAIIAWGLIVTRRSRNRRFLARRDPAPDDPASTASVPDARGRNP